MTSTLSSEAMFASPIKDEPDSTTTTTTASKSNGKPEKAEKTVKVEKVEKPSKKRKEVSEEKEEGKSGKVRKRKQSTPKQQQQQQQQQQSNLPLHSMAVLNLFKLFEASFQENLETKKTFPAHMKELQDVRANEVPSMFIQVGHLLTHLNNLQLNMNFVEEGELHCAKQLFSKSIELLPSSFCPFLEELVATVHECLKSNLLL